MRASTAASFAAAALFSLIARGAMAQPSADLEPLLLSETLWTWQAGDGPATNAWFEKVAGQLTMVRCAAASPSCRAAVRVSSGALEIGHAPGAIVLRRRTHAPFMLAGSDGSALFPSWVIPAAGSRTGH